MHSDITLCITMGRRPDLLRQTLESLKNLPRIPVLAVNDFGDRETDDVFREFYPDGHIAGPGHRIGHHPAVDELYRHVKTPLIFHIEDDWLFDRPDFLDQAARLLAAEPMISSVCVRDSRDMPISAGDLARIRTESRDGIEYERLDDLHEKWFGYTFNPHVFRLSMWQDLGGFSRFRKERGISRFLRKKGYYVAFLRPSACRHLGEGRSSRDKPRGALKHCESWLRKKIGRRA